MQPMQSTPEPPHIYVSGTCQQGIKPLKQNKTKRETSHTPRAHELQIIKKLKEIGLQITFGNMGLNLGGDYVHLNINILFI